MKPSSLNALFLLCASAPCAFAKPSAKQGLRPIFYAMPLPKNLSAKFAVGDRVRLQAGVTWTIVGRYWRPRTREVVYELKAPNLDYVTRQPERLLHSDDRPVEARGTVPGPALG